MKLTGGVMEGDIDLNGEGRRLILDADGDTYISVFNNEDDRIDWFLANATNMTLNTSGLILKGNLRVDGTIDGYATDAELDARTLTNSFTWCDNSQSSVTNTGPRLNETNTIQRITYWCCGGSAVVNLYSGHWTNTAPSALLTNLSVTTARQETNVSIGIDKDWLLSYWPTNTAWTNLYLDIMMERQD